MVTYIKKKKKLFSIPIVLVLFVSSSYAKSGMMKVTKDKIETICTQDPTINSTYCFEILKPTIKIATLDLSGLAKYLINYQSQKYFRYAATIKGVQKQKQRISALNRCISPVWRYMKMLFITKILPSKLWQPRITTL